MRFIRTVDSHYVCISSSEGRGREGGVDDTTRRQQQCRRHGGDGRDGDGESKQEQEEWSQFNDRMRKNSAQFFHTSPGPRLTMMATVFQPIAAMIAGSLECAGSGWLHKCLAALARGSAMKYRILVSTHAADEFFVAVQMLLFNLGGEAWIALGSSQRSASLASLAFRALSHTAGTCSATPMSAKFAQLVCVSLNGHTARGRAIGPGRQLVPLVTPTHYWLWRMPGTAHSVRPSHRARGFRQL